MDPIFYCFIINIPGTLSGFEALPVVWYTLPGGNPALAAAASSSYDGILGNESKITSNVIHCVPTLTILFLFKSSNPLPITNKSVELVAVLYLPTAN